MPNHVGVTTVTTRMYCMSRYGINTGVQANVIKVPVEYWVVNLGWGDDTEEVVEDYDTSNRQIVRL